MYHRWRSINTTSPCSEGGSTHGWYSLELFLPLINELSGFPQVFYFIALPVWDATRKRVSGVRRFFDEPFEVPQSVVDGGPGLRVFLRGTLASLCVRPGPFLGVVGLAFQFGGPLARLLQVGASFHVQYPAVVNLQDSPIQIGPAVGVLLGSTRPAEQPRTACRPPWSRSSLSAWSPQGSRTPLQDVQGLHGLLVKIVNLGVRLGFLLVCHC